MYELLFLSKKDIPKDFSHYVIVQPSKKAFIDLVMPDLDLNSGIFLLVESNDYAPLARKVLWCNIEELCQCKIYFEIIELLHQFPERFKALLKTTDEVSISEQEKGLFKMLGEQYDSLLMVKTKISDIPTTAVCIIEKDSAGQEEIKPIAILVNEAIFKLLTPPEDILPENE
jgi:hypothetical protein